MQRKSDKVQESNLILHNRRSLGRHCWSGVVHPGRARTLIKPCVPRIFCSYCGSTALNCPVRALHTVQNVKPKTVPFIPGKTHRGIWRAWGTKAQSKLRQKLHGDRMPSITHTRNLIDSPPCTLPAPAGLFFSICNKNCWLDNFAIDYFSWSQPNSFVVHHSRRRKHTYKK